MKINIFGVGRSGTKAIQLYFSYLIAKKFGNVWINYEPYFWKDRLLSNRCYEGIYHHINSPLFITSKYEVRKLHKLYLKRLVNNKKHVISKFIRACGRVKLINKVLKPDYTIIIIRDLYEVLDSILVKNWDLLGNNLNYSFYVRNDWDKLKKEVRNKKIINDFVHIQNRIKNKMDMNAFYWYVMNIALLKIKDKNTFFVKYDNLSRIKKIGKSIGLDKNKEIFRGYHLHNNYILEGNNLSSSQIKRILNLLFLQSPLLSRFKIILPEKSGSRAKINHKYKLKLQDNKITKIKSKINIPINEVYEYMNNKVNEKLEKIMF